MSIDKFLDDLDGKEKEQVDLALKKKEQDEIEDELIKQYLSDFDKLYAQQIVKSFQSVSEKLSDRFEVSFEESPTEMHYLINQVSMTLMAKFKTKIKKVRIRITIEGVRKLISLGGDVYSGEDKIINDKSVHIFQDTVEVFNNLNLENKIGEILRRIYI